MCDDGSIDETYEVAEKYRSDYPDRKLLEQAALSCPVKHSLHPDIEIPITWKWVG
jgi:glycosyltransferase involved in cell wall biosynthesis